MIDWKSSYWKVAWFLLVLGLLTYLVISNWSAYLDGTSKPFEIIIFLIWIALLLAPLFREVSFFGVNLKNEIGSLRNDVEKQIVSLKSDVRNIFYLYPTTPPSDSELQDLEKSIKPIFEKTLKEHGIDKAVPLPQEVEVPSDTQFLFSVRYAIENELKRIGKWLWVPPEERRYRTALQIADNLSKRGTIIPTSVDMIREVLAICSAAIHGEDVTEASVKFVKDTSSTLLPYLKSIEEQPPSWMQQQPPPWLGNQRRSEKS